MRQLLSAVGRRLVRFASTSARPVREALAGDEVCIIRTDDGALLARALFRAAFGEDPPREPVHYVALLTTKGALLRVAGYVHLAPRDGYGLIGGLCVDDRHRRHGIARRLLERIVTDGAHPVYFAQMVHPASLAVCRDLGFEPTSLDRVHARWSSAIGAERRAALVREVGAIGLF